MTIKLNTETLRYIAALENESKAVVKDCVVNGDTIVYVIEEGQIGAAIGKNGANVKKIRTNLGKKVHLVEFSKDPVKFTSNLIGKTQNTMIKNIYLEKNGKNKKIIIEADFKARGTILGKKGKNIQLIKDLLKRHYNIGDVIVK